jgi:2',3'-cyclic-nucleotide 2'-phosphodiesterase/3'-nucleotidase/5'-nucleotidase
VRDLRLDPGMFPNATALQADERLGRLVVSTVAADLDGDGDVDRLRTLGGRSFSIRRADGSLVHDSGDLIERYTAQDALYAPAPNLFNTPDDENSFDERSDNRGPQPDNVAVARIHGHSYAFVALERTSIVLVVDVTDPERPMLLGHAGTRDFTEDPKATGGADTGLYVNCAAGDLGPEGLLVIPADESPVGAPLLVVGYQTSGSTRVFRIATGRRGGR